MDSKESFELRLAAMFLWHYKGSGTRVAIEAAESEQKRRIENFRTELHKIIGHGYDIDIIINGGCLEALVEDVHFVAYEFTLPDKKQYSTLVTLLGRCPDCGAEIMSAPFYNLEGLGKMLVEFQPIKGHFCKYQRKEISGK